MQSRYSSKQNLLVEKYYAKKGTSVDAKYRADREINLANFKELMRVFNEYSSGSASKTVDYDGFKMAFSKVLGNDLTDEQMRLLFMQIDSNTDNAIDWNDFSTYMLMRAEGKKAMRDKEETRLFEHASIPRHQTPHKDMIVKIQYLPSTNRYMTVSREGTIAFWNEKMKLARSFPYVGQIKSKKEITRGGKNVCYRWIHDAIYLEAFQKIILASDDHSITIYEASIMEKILILDLQNSNPLSIDFHTSTESGVSALYYGTDQGYVNVFYFSNEKLSNSYSKQDGDVEVLSLEKEKFKSWGTLWKRKAHNDWVVKVIYIPELKAILSCSPDPERGMVLAVAEINQKWRYTESSIVKGASCAAFCKSPICIITGGSDHHLRIWNPRRAANPTYKLKGHNTPISQVAINETHAQLISLSIDKELRIWDIRKQRCLQIFNHYDVQSPDDTFTSLIFNAMGEGKILIGSSTLECYQLEERVAKEHDKSHELPIRAIIYNPVFKMVVSACEEGEVNVWDIQSGQKQFRFFDDHGQSEITAIAFDSSYRRLITAARDGCIRSWNFNNGQMLQELVIDDKTDISNLLCIDMKKNKFIIAIGGNRNIYIFIDDPNALTLHPNCTLGQDSNSKKWHSEDILSLAFLAPNLLATGSYNGEIVVSNLDSGHILTRLLVESEAGRSSVDCLTFIVLETSEQPISVLVSCGARGIIRFWNFQQSFCIFEQDCTMGRKSGIFCVKPNSSNTQLITGDAMGWVCVWDLNNVIEEKEIKIIIEFRAHMSVITSLDVMDDGMIITSSEDCTVRLFTSKGDYIGAFGKDEWDLNVLSSHQRIPWDIPIENETSTLVKEEKQTQSKSVQKLHWNEEDVDTWYRKTLFAKEHFKPKTKRIIRKYNVEKGRIFSRLNAFELADTKDKLPMLRKENGRWQSMNLHIQ